jgi:hypothetical protein
MAKIGKKSVGPSARPVEGGIAKIDFSKMGATAPSKGKPPKYPLLEGKEVAEKVDNILTLEEKYDAVADLFKTAKSDLVEFGFEPYFIINRGKTAPPSSLLAYGTLGGLRVTYKDKFTASDAGAEIIEGQLIKLLGEEAVAKWFHQKWVIQIDGDAIPEALGGEVAAGIQEFMAKKGCAHAIKVKAQILPRKGFADQRHFAFSPSENMDIQKLIPQQGSVSSKGVK